MDHHLLITTSDGTPITTLTGQYVTTPSASFSKSYTLTATDSVILADATSAAFQVTLPTAAGATGRQYTIKRINSGGNNVTVGCTGGQSIDGASTKTLSAQNTWLTVVSY